MRVAPVTRLVLAGLAVAVAGPSPADGQATPPLPDASFPEPAP